MPLLVHGGTFRPWQPYVSSSTINLHLQGTRDHQDNITQWHTSTKRDGQMFETATHKIVTLLYFIINHKLVSYYNIVTTSRHPHMR